MSRLTDAALRFRAQLLRQERAAASEMVRAYAAAWRRLRAELAQLEAQIAEAQAAGLVVGPFTPRQPGGPVIAQAPGTFSVSWVYRRERLLTLLAQVERELRQFNTLADELTTAGQLQAVQAAQANAQALMAEAARAAGAPELVGMFNRLPTSAVEELVGLASDGSPLRELFEAMGERTGRGVREALETAVATGMGPRETARLVRQQFGMGLRRALTIARTEQIRAYREASGRTYEANADVLDGWVWLSAADARTCASCLAMHGSAHAVQRRIDSHPNCRCVMLPRVQGAPIEVTPGEELFAQMTPAQQREKLGPAMYEAWLDGRVRLTPDGPGSVVGRRENADWGPMRYARSLQEIVGQRDAKAYVSLAQREAKLSANETDRLMRRLIRSGRAATTQEVEQIAARVAQAPFNTRLVPSKELNGYEHLGRTTEERDNSDWIHLVKRVKTQQWGPMTTLNEYVDDLHAASRQASKIAVYQRNGGNIVLLWAETKDVIHPERLGANSGHEMVVIYLADRGMIISGYQVSSLSTVNIPESAQWLRS